MPNHSLIEADRKHLIHPVISYRAHEARGVTVLESARGAFLRDAAGNELLDAFSGLWCVNVGYGQQSIVDAATEQMKKLPYATSYFHFGSAPAIELAQKLVEVSPASLQHVYFTLGGSDAVDSAIRFITHYFNATGRPARKHIIALQRGYHGSSTMGAGLTALPAFHRNFDLPLPNQHHLPSPYAYRNDFADDAALIAASVAALEAKVAELGADNVAAFFCEPIQGSGGVIVPPVGWLKAMRDSCRKLGILFVADEVITGFGRTGPLFACQGENVEPDLMTVAKGLTAGYAPMGAVLMSDEIYQASRTATPKRWSATAIRTRRIRSAPRSASKYCASITKAACSRTASPVARASHAASTRCSRIRWWATRATAACSARSNWCRTRTAKPVSIRR